jgi:hypothetical protein
MTVSYGKMVKTKERLGYDGPCARVKGKLEARYGEVRVEGLAPMDQGNGESGQG